MKTSTSEGIHGIQWTSRMQLGDLDFTDDLTILLYTHYTISNNLLCKRTNKITAEEGNKKKRWKWIEHTLKKAHICVTRQALKWNPADQRKRGRPKNTLRREMEKQMNKNRNELEKKAQDGVGWRMLVGGAYSIGSNGRKCLKSVKNIIVEQSSLYINLLDYEKAFDNVDRTTLWKLHLNYSVPEKIDNFTQNSFYGLNCKIVHEGQLTDSFEVMSSVSKESPNCSGLKSSVEIIPQIDIICDDTMLCSHMEYIICTFERRGSGAMSTTPFRRNEPCQEALTEIIISDYLYPALRIEGILTPHDEVLNSSEFTGSIQHSTTIEKIICEIKGPENFGD
ncbi:unnamed protein product [Schistosoma margrebowiei]|uniref:Uncharacterized protein n=1 Tax=Schistosoma margrebowiei TaxID=48269 RepID=A0A183N8S2_9TREM|nr:unnamed protein product [Schistosoma margrebowiei]